MKTTLKEVEVVLKVKMCHDIVTGHIDVEVSPETIFNSICNLTDSYWENVEALAQEATDDTQTSVDIHRVFGVGFIKEAQKKHIHQQIVSLQEQLNNL